MSVSFEELWPDGHQLAVQLDRQYAEELRRLEEAGRREQQTESVLSDIREEEEAIAFNAGITWEDYHALLEQGEEGMRIFQLLSTGRAPTIPEAELMLDQRVNEKIDDFSQMMQTRWGDPQWARLNAQIERHDHPPRRGRGKRDLQKSFQSWRQQQEWQAQSDEAFYQMSKEWQKHQ